jgi:glycosyltransferase involved in cell wall biosynthesis
MTEPVASVIIPAWNAAEYLERAVGSALSQTEQHVEVLIVNDASTDATGEIAAALAKQDQRVSALTTSIVHGPSAARNVAIAAARGRWIAPLDADDWFKPERVERLVAEAERRGLDLLADNLDLTDHETGLDLGPAVDPQLMALTGEMSLGRFLRSDWPGRNLRFRGAGFLKPIIRRTFLAKHNLCYDERFRLGEDTLFYATAMASGARFGVTASSFYYYSVRLQSISHRSHPTAELIDVNDCIAKCVSVNAFDEQGLSRLLKLRDAALRFQVLTWSIRVGHWSAARRMAASLGVQKVASLALSKAVTLLVRQVAGVAAGLEKAVSVRRTSRPEQKGGATP